MFRLVIFVLFAAAAAAAHAQTYRWVDPDGKVHYSDTPPPASAGKSAQKKSLGASAVDAPGVPYSTQLAAKNFPVTLYTAQNCEAACSDARALLAKRGVPFKEVAIVNDETRGELKRVSGGDEVPVMMVGRDVTRGFGADAYRNALDSAGYPQSAPAVAQQSVPKQAPEAKPEPKPEAPPSGRYTPKF